MTQFQSQETADMHDHASTLPRVSVLMPVRNEGSFIARSLGAVLAQDYPAEFMEVIVADGGSTDGTLETIRSLQVKHGRVRVIDNPFLTVPFGMNLATESATGDILVRVDGHCEIAPDYVRRCVDHLVNDGVDGVGGCLETVGETPTAESIALALSSRFGVGGVAFRTHTGGNMLADTIPFPAYKRETVELAGPYDDEQKRNQDDEYNYRIREKGGRLLLAQDVRSRYYSRATLTKLGRQYFEYGFWKVRVAQKHPRQMQVRQFVPLAFVSSLLIAAVLAPFFRPAWIVLAVIAGGYVIANLAESVRLARGHGWRHIRILPVAFFLLHSSYGTGFLVGLARFAGKWRVAHGPRT